MPARQPFDERHLQDVVLAQSGDIRAERRFSGLQIVTRPVVALAAIVAILAIALGIKDYVEQRNATAPADASAPSSEQINATTRPKKTTSAKTSRTRMSASEATATEMTQAAADETGKAPISQESVDAGAKRTSVMENTPNPLMAQAPDNEREAAVDHDNAMRNELGVVAKPGLPTCLPLPNGTKPADVDAPYYFGWAGEYCGHDLNRSSAPPKVPESQPSKR